MAGAAEVAVSADRQACACGTPPAQQPCHVSWSAIKYEPPSHRISVHARPLRTGPCAPEPPIAAVRVRSLEHRMLSRQRMMRRSPSSWPVVDWPGGVVPTECLPVCAGEVAATIGGVPGASWTSPLMTTGKWSWLCIPGKGLRVLFRCRDAGLRAALQVVGIRVPGSRPYP